MAIGLILWVLLEHTQLGRHLYAIGGSAEASRLSGIAVKRYAPIALAICALCAGLGGLMAASVLGAGRPQGVGDTYLLNAFAAVFIGAPSLRPGKFHIVGTLIGAMLIGVINNGLSILGVPTYWQYIRTGRLADRRAFQRRASDDAAALKTLAIGPPPATAASPTVLKYPTCVSKTAKKSPHSWVK